MPFFRARARFGRLHGGGARRCAPVYYGRGLRPQRLQITEEENSKTRRALLWRHDVEMRRSLGATAKSECEIGAEQSGERCRSSRLSNPSSCLIKAGSLRTALAFVDRTGEANHLFGHLVSSGVQPFGRQGAERH